MLVTNQGSVRVDLVGGTLDLEPINFILPHAYTLNVATSLKAKVEIEFNDSEELLIKSKDYQKEYSYSLKELSQEKIYQSSYFKEMSFIVQIIDFFELNKGLKVTLSSGAPAGSGLGGSSAMGVTLFKALGNFLEKSFTTQQIVQHVKTIESRILNQGMPGYQDYYPALTGGVLALYPEKTQIKVEQCFSNELKENLEKRILLIFSGQSRKSGINNWEVYKNFFDQESKTRSGMEELAVSSKRAYEALKTSDFDELLKAIALDGSIREKLFPGIVSEKIASFYQECQKIDEKLGMKVCGAGGGGCFLLTHSGNKLDLIKKLILEHDMQLLPFEIESPL